jgi:hypothetical protein
VARALEGAADAKHNGATTYLELVTYPRATVLQLSRGKQEIFDGPGHPPDATVFQNQSLKAVGVR